jgi:16S rRNA G966 N2-methylase RsmD
MKQVEVLKKFGGLYIADENTYKMGIDQRITKQIAKRFKNLTILETCTGAGFTTISLAKVAKKVITIEINQNTQKQAKQNIQIAGYSDKVDFILGDALDKNLLVNLKNIDAALLDPDWNDIGFTPVYKFKNSNMKPPADILLNTVLNLTQNIVLILPPFVSENEFDDLNEYELQKIYLDDELALFCIYFGSLKNIIGISEMNISE